MSQSRILRALPPSRTLLSTCSCAWIVPTFLPSPPRPLSLPLLSFSLSTKKKEKKKKKKRKNEERTSFESESSHERVYVHCYEHVRTYIRMYVERVQWLLRVKDTPSLVKGKIYTGCLSRERGIFREWNLIVAQTCTSFLHVQRVS